MCIGMLDWPVSIQLSRRVITPMTPPSTRMRFLPAIAMGSSSVVKELR